MSADEVELLAFALGGERCALPVRDVREVVRAALPARLPKAPLVVTGALWYRVSSVLFGVDALVTTGRMR